MTREEFAKIKLRFVSHMAMTDEHATSYYNDRYKIGICRHTPMVDGQPFGRKYTHYQYKGVVYKTKKKLLEAIKHMPYFDIPEEDYL